MKDSLLTNKQALKKTRNYMFFRLGWDYQFQDKVLKEYGESIGMEIPKEEKEKKKVLEKLGQRIQSGYWDDFYQIMIKYPKQTPPRISNNDNYDDEWNEKNLDGSFAYNGVTDDF